MLYCATNKRHDGGFVSADIFIGFLRVETLGMQSLPRDYQGAAGRLLQLRQRLRKNP